MLRTLTAPLLIMYSSEQTSLARKTASSAGRVTSRMRTERLAVNPDEQPAKTSLLSTSGRLMCMATSMRRLLDSESKTRSLSLLACSFSYQMVTMSLARSALKWRRDTKV